MNESSSIRAIRVVHAVLSLDCGGLERVVLDLIRGGRTRGQQVSVICLERRGELAGQAESLGATVHCVHKPAGIDFRLRGRLQRTLKQLRPDVVHTHQIGALFYAGGAARGLGVSTIVHSEHGVHFRNRIRTRVLAACAARYADRFFCVSEEIAADVRRLGIARQSRIRVIRNGVDNIRFSRVDGGGELRRSLGFPADAFVIGTVGRLVEIKRQDVLIHGFSRLLQQVPQARLLLVGDGPLGEELRELAGQLGISAHVHFAGYQAQTEKYLQAMDVFALTSRSEGMPLAILEAWSVGLPVIASRVGGLPEMIRDGENGLLFSSGDDSELASNLALLFRDQGLAQRLGAAGQREVRSHYDIMSMVDAYHRHYLQLLEGKPTNTDANPCDHQSVSQSLSASAGDV